MITIAAIASDNGEVTVLRSRSTGAVLYYQGLCNQSEADRNGVSLAVYIHAIFGLLLQSECNDVLMIGCGGGTLATMLRAADVKVTIVDVNPRSFEIGRAYFGLPKEVDCHVGDGQEFLLANPHRYDAIVLDAYEGGEIPHHFTTRAFFRLAALRLVKSKGCFMANICPSHAFDQVSDQIAALMSPALRNVRILDGEHAADRNAIVIAGAVKDLQRPILLQPPETQSREIALNLERLKFREPRPVRSSAIPCTPLT